jgi:hypothetical protein
MAELEEPHKSKNGEAAGRVAIILATGISIALNVITGALLYAAFIRLGVDINSGLSDNGVQILLAWGGGIISVLAGYVGYVVGKKTNGIELPESKPKPEEPKPEEPKPEEPK